MSKEVNKLKDKMFKELKLFCVDLTFYIFCKTLDPDPDPEDPWIRIRNTGGMNWKLTSKKDAKVCLGGALSKRDREREVSAGSCTTTWYMEPTTAEKLKKKTDNSNERSAVPVNFYFNFFLF